MKIKNSLSWSGFLGASSVVVLALAAHALEKKLEIEQLNAVKTAGQIQLFHAIALLSMSILSVNFPKQFEKAIKMMIYGTIMFSFSIYLIVLKDISGLEFLKFLWPVTPAGGLVLILSWILIIVESRSIEKS
jgi:uncharacterized membrane protein YgdD (TMEM256/DUF423 family)